MSLSSYLAQKYLTATAPTSKSSKKRKRKTPTSSTSGLVIADDDVLGWSTRNLEDDGDDEDGIPLTIKSRSADFKKTKTSGWKVVGAPALQPRDNEADTAEQIVAQAARERRAQGSDDEDVVVEDEAGIVKMGDGTHAGLQSAADVKRQFEKRRREELEAWEAEERRSGRRKQKKKKRNGEQGQDDEDGEGEGDREETVYRDATGRRIDISMRKRELRREADEQARREAQEREAAKGDVQMATKAQRREELDDAKFLPVARGVEDQELNQALKARERWNDPAMGFLKKTQVAKSITGRPLYQGPWMPNRYAIRPGHRWDGVDRGNGWEGERFKGANRRERESRLKVEWEMDE